MRCLSSQAVQEDWRRGQRRHSCVFGDSQGENPCCLTNPYCSDFLRFDQRDLHGRDAYDATGKRSSHHPPGCATTSYYDAAKHAVPTIRAHSILVVRPRGLQRGGIGPCSAVPGRCVVNPALPASHAFGQVRNRGTVASDRARKHWPLWGLQAIVQQVDRGCFCLLGKRLHTLARQVWEMRLAQGLLSGTAPACDPSPG